VADHRVERIDRSVRDKPGDPGDRAPQQRRHHGVRGVLGDRLDHRPGYLPGVQPGGIAAAQAREDFPGGGEIVAVEG
jgi:hypothetical protein